MDDRVSVLLAGRQVAEASVRTALTSRNTRAAQAAHTDYAESINRLANASDVSDEDKGRLREALQRWESAYEWPAPTPTDAKRAQDRAQAQISAYARQHRVSEGEAAVALFDGKSGDEGAAAILADSVRATADAE